MFPGESRGPGPTLLLERGARPKLRAWAPAFAGEHDTAKGNDRNNESFTLFGQSGRAVGNQPA